ncbi:hypothetical protein Poli38472_013935 [Pythium oligandrum]|uniref:Uncharacterized protein n=1 Tax=Pythium oligandrum TaxID=41045 RepID=A0A8K1C2D1_PYTOL|nr:hypothetical protein Poli38472_013935 [Pythium oligandrum]|eukprot:TMW55173.1 hypothetical protein Poli38472_013935 [Pythium oligandrum]
MAIMTRTLVLRRRFSAYTRRPKTIMLFASEVPVVSAMNPYRKIEDVFMGVWKRTNPKQIAALSKELQLEVVTPEEKVQAIVEELGATSAIGALLEEAATAETTMLVVETAAKLEAALPAATPVEVKEEVVQFFASEMNKAFGAKQESPAIQHYEKQEQVAVEERNLEFFKKRVASVADNYEVFVGGKIDGRADGKVVEVKNRMKRFMNPLPKYDVAQLQTYLFILGGTEGELVEHLRHDKAQTKLTKVPWDAAMWENEIEPYIVRFGGALAHFMKDREAQTQFLAADPPGQRDIIRDHWLR